MSSQKLKSFCHRFAIGFSAIAVSTIASGAAPSEWRTLVSPELLALYPANAVREKLLEHGAGATGSPSSNFGARLNGAGRVEVDVLYNCAVAAPLSALKASGLVIANSVHLPPTCVVEGWITPSALPSIAAVPGVQRITVPAYAAQRPRRLGATPSVHSLALQHVQQPSAQAQGAAQAIDGAGVSLMRADQYVAQTGVNGSGVTIGVMSDNVYSLSLIQSRGELPAVNVVAPSPGGALSASTGDEGTMMLQEVHAVAPGATLAFCAPGTSVGYTGCLGQLIAAGATVIVDDLGFPTVDIMSSNSAFEQTVQNVLTQNAAVALFSVTENYNGSYWEGVYSPVSIAAQNLGISTLTCPATGQIDAYFLNFSGQIRQTLTVYQAGTYPFIFQWADTFGANSSNFDIYYVNVTTGASGCIPTSTSSNTYLGPNETLAVGTYYLYVATPDTSLAGKFMKFWVGGDGNTELSVPTTGSVTSAQTFVPGVVTVGAVIGSDGIGNTIEPYSGRGPINLVFPSAMQISAPTVVAPDAVYVDAAGTNFAGELWPDGFFHGTSAASPNAAAVAGLLRAAFPSLTPTEVTAALQAGATPLGSGFPNGTFGYGRVDALGALATIPAPTISGGATVSVTGPTSTPSSPLTVTGVGSLSISVSSSNAKLIPATFVAAGTAGVSISPSTCGAGTNNCMLSVTPVLGQVGSATVTVTATDGAHRIATTTSTVTVVAPSAPTLKITGGQSQADEVNTPTFPVTFNLTGTGPLRVSVASSNTTVLPTSAVSLASGCGTSTNTCTATLAPVTGQTGTSSITITATDPYGQSASAVANLNVTTPPPAPAPTASGKSGGGAFDVWSLLPLGAMAALRRRRANTENVPPSQIRTADGSGVA